MLYTTASQETLNLATPQFAGGTTIDATYQLDTQINYLPPGVDITYYWRLTDSNGDVTETDAKTFLWEDSRFAWTSVTTGQVTVYAYNGDETFNRQILDTAQRTIDRLQDDFGLKRSRPVRIWAYSSKEDFAGAQAPNSEPWIAGTSFTELSLVLAVLPPGDTVEVGRVVPHEIAHQVLHQVTENPFNRPPTWMDEGLAVYYQEGGNEGFPSLVQDAADGGRLMSVRALNSLFPYDPAEATLAYAESFSIVSFIINTFGEDEMAALIEAVGEGVTYDEVVREALGVTLDDLDRQWKASLGYQGDAAPGAVDRDDDSGNPTGGVNDPAVSLASGGFVMAAVSLIAVVSGISAVRRSRRGAGESVETAV